MTSWAPQIGLTMFVVMILLMALRVPIAVAMFIPGLIGYGLMSDVNTTLNFLKGSAVARLTVYELSVIPLFLLMTILLNAQRSEANYLKLLCTVSQNMITRSISGLHNFGR